MEESKTNCPNCSSGNFFVTPEAMTGGIYAHCNTCGYESPICSGREELQQLFYHQFPETFPNYWKIYGICSAKTPQLAMMSSSDSKGGIAISRKVKADEH